VKLCKVLGNVVSTVKHPDFAGLKLLVCQPVDEAGADAGPSFLAVDRVSQAGPGDLVLVNQEGGGARQLFKARKLCIRSVIVGVVDAVEAVGAPAARAARA
jgi:ethanolamine utilization protein EutN